MVRKILTKINKELEERKTIKDELYDAMRRATRFSKSAIFSIHKEKMKEARKLLAEAKKIFDTLDKIPMKHKQLTYAGIVDAAFQEFAEANIFIELVKNQEFITPEKIKVPSTSYLLGLVDVIGEFRRRVLDSLRKGSTKNAEKNFETMQLIYSELMGMDEALHSVPELRRKSDIARRIIEATRGDITIEVRRSCLEHSIEKLEKALTSERS